MQKSSEEIDPIVIKKCQLMLQFAGIKDQDLLAMYLRGSRGIDTHNPNSDYDFVIVLRNEIPIGQLRFYHQDIDFTVLEEKEFIDRIIGNDIGTLEAIYTPKVVKEVKNYRDLYKVNIQKLHSITKRKARFRKKMYLRQLNDKEKKKNNEKNIFIAIRYLDYGIQLIQNGKIADLRSCNHIWDEIKDGKTTVEHNINIYKEKKRAFYSLTNQKKPMTGPLPNDILDKLEKHKLPVVNYLRENGTKLLEKDLRLHCQRHSKYPELVQIYYRVHRPSPFADLISDCRGIVLNQNDNFSVVAYPYKKFTKELTTKLNTINIENYKIFEKLDGSMIIMFNYKDEWHLTTLHNVDGNSPLCIRVKPISVDQAFWEVFKSRGH